MNKAELTEALWGFNRMLEKQEVSMKPYFSCGGSLKLSLEDYTMIGSSVLVLQDKLPEARDIDLLTDYFRTNITAKILYKEGIQAEFIKSTSSGIHDCLTFEFANRKFDILDRFHEKCNERQF